MVRRPGRVLHITNATLVVRIRVGLLALRAQRLRRPQDATSTHASRIPEQDGERWSDKVSYGELLAQSPRTWSAPEPVLPPASLSSAKALTNAELGAKRWARAFSAATVARFAAAAFGVRSPRARGYDAERPPTRTGTGRPPAAIVPAVKSGRTLFELIRRGMNIAATIKTRAGYAFNVVVTQDVVFLDPYKERVRP